MGEMWLTIADLFMTNRHDSSITQTSSYLDLSPLYGNNQDEQNLMRTFQDGRIKPDCFSNKRVLGFPPGVGKRSNCLPCSSIGGLTWNRGYVDHVQPFS